LAGGIGGVTVCICAAASVGAGAGAGSVCAGAAGNTYAVAGLGAAELFEGAVLLVDATVIAIATVAIDYPPKIHGRRSLS
jgi:hypothetical protein